MLPLLLVSMSAQKGATKAEVFTGRLSEGKEYRGVPNESTPLAFTYKVCDSFINFHRPHAHRYEYFR